MKKKMRKLTLSKETLINLNNGYLRAVAGGSAAESDCASDCFACASDVCSQDPVCVDTGTCNCSIGGGCCSRTRSMAMTCTN